ncbi:MAG: hypothetical protein HYR55_05300 [Acidobacteria bacterium]|nr:hypothetical protein [Acidobacteriota bacterium]MBI3658394.1 hypothetical protein [Acidobacteriota bacterium]
MAVKEKEKRQQQAEKYVLQGKITSAISEYKKIAEDSPSDIALLNTIGDLHVLAGQPTQAITYFARVSAAYLKGGFHSKAIAMQKKVVSLDPQNLESLSKLADLYMKQGLSAEAKNGFLAVAAGQEKRGMSREAIESYLKCLSITPDDCDIELRLAELYIKTTDKPKATVYYSRAGAHLAELKRGDESRLALDRALQIDSTFAPALKGCLALCRLTGQYADLIKRLEEANRARPEDLDLMEILGEAYLAEDCADVAEPYLRKVLALDSNRYESLLSLATYYFNKVAFDKAVEQIQAVSAILLSRREVDRVISFLMDILAVSPNQVSALTHLAEVYEKTNNWKDALSALGKVVDIYVGGENYADAIKIIQHIVEVDPGNTKYLQLHRELFAEAFPGETYRPLLPESPADEPEKSPAEVFSDSVTKPRSPAAIAESGDLDVAVEIDLSEDLKDIFAPDPIPKTPVAAVLPDEPQLPPMALTIKPAEPKSPVPATVLHSAEADLQEIDFYIRLGFLQEAHKRLLELAQRSPDNSDLQRQYELLQVEAEKSGVKLAEVEWPAPPPPKAARESDAALDGPAIDKSRSINVNNQTLEFTLDSEAEAKAPAAPPKHSIRWLEGIRPEGNGDEAVKPKPFSEIVEDVQNYIGGDKDADFQTQFDLGVAYKEMGLLDEAIGQFQAAYRLAKAAGNPNQTARCCIILSGCFLAKEMPAAAIRWSRLALAAPGLSEDETFAIKYELASAYEKCHDTSQALEYFHEIYEMNIHYRDVAQRITQLSGAVNSK